MRLCDSVNIPSRKLISFWSLLLLILRIFEVSHTSQVRSPSFAVSSPVKSVTGYEGEQIVTMQVATAEVNAAVTKLVDFLHRCVYMRVRESERDSFCVVSCCVCWCVGRASMCACVGGKCPIDVLLKYILTWILPFLCTSAMGYDSQVHERAATYQAIMVAIANTVALRCSDPSHSFDEIAEPQKIEVDMNHSHELVHDIFLQSTKPVIEGNYVTSVTSGSSQSYSKCVCVCVWASEREKEREIEREKCVSAFVCVCVSVC